MTYLKPKGDSPPLLLQSSALFFCTSIVWTVGVVWSCSPATTPYHRIIYTTFHLVSVKPPWLQKSHGKTSGNLVPTGQIIPSLRARPIGLPIYLPHLSCHSDSQRQPVYSGLDGKLQGWLTQSQSLNWDWSPSRCNKVQQYAHLIT